MGSNPIVSTIDALPTADRDTVDYDHHRPLREWDPATVHAALRAQCPAAYSEAHDGFWVVTAYDLVERCARDASVFSSDHDLEGTRAGREFQGIGIPAQASYRSIPSEVDAPEFLDYRRLLQPWFTPTAAERWAGRVRGWAEECVARGLASGRIDLVLDVANPVPAMFTLAVVGLPLDEWERFAEPLHRLVYVAPESPERRDALGAIAQLRADLADTVADRRREPRDDLATVVANAEIAGRTIDVSDAVNVLFTVISGGVDTTTGLLANAFMWLHEHRDQRARLIGDPALRAGAREEWLRVFSPAPATARTVTRDVELGTAALGRGERVLLSWTAANRDPAVFVEPDEVRLDRNASRHLAFGAGPHRCIGSAFARAAFDATLDVVLRTIPDYEIDTDRAERYERVGAVNGWVSLPATFTRSGGTGTGGD